MALLGNHISGKGGLKHSCWIYKVQSLVILAVLKLNAISRNLYQTGVPWVAVYNICAVKKNTFDVQWLCMSCKMTSELRTESVLIIYLSSCLYKSRLQHYISSLTRLPNSWKAWQVIKVTVTLHMYYINNLEVRATLKSCIVKKYICKLWK